MADRESAVEAPGAGAAAEGGTAASEEAARWEALRLTLAAREAEIQELREFCTLERQANAGDKENGGEAEQQQQQQQQHEQQQQQEQERQELRRQLAQTQAELAKAKGGFDLLKQIATQEFFVGGNRRAMMEQASRVVSVVDQDL